jgi:hypothetical protein
MKIKIYQMNNDCKALGAYAVDSIKSGIGEIMIDFDGIESEQSLSDIQKKTIITDAIKHEIHHALSDFFGLPLEDPDGMCGGTESQEMVIVPLYEHEKIVSEKDKQIKRLKKQVRKLKCKNYGK